MTATSRTTGAITALLVFLSLGLFGDAGWLAALVLALVAGVLLAAFLHWLVDQGSPPMDGSDWAPGPEAVPMPDAPAPAPVIDAAPAPIDDPSRPLPDAARSIYPAAPDALIDIKGIGPKLEQALNQAGVTRFAQIAAWDAAQIEAIADRIGRSAARIRSEDWVGQARAMANGGAVQP